MRNNYLTHQLNKSPTKTSYTFARSPRFATSKDAKQNESTSLARSKVSSRGKSQTNSVISKASSKKLQRKNLEKQKTQRSRLRSRSKSKQIIHFQNKEITSIHNYYNKIDKEEQNLLDDSNNTKKTYATIKTSYCERSSRNRMRGTRNINEDYDTISKTNRKKQSQQRKKPVGYTFPKSPRKFDTKAQSMNNVGPGDYAMFSQFGS